MFPLLQDEFIIRKCLDWRHGSSRQKWPNSRRYEVPANAPSRDLEEDTQPKIALWAFIIANPIS
jgi:hypothetical protein